MTLRLGVVANKPYIRYAISTALAQQPFDISFVDAVNGINGSSLEGMDIWLLVAAEAGQSTDTIGKKSPMLILDEEIPSVANAEYLGWQQRLQKKLADITRHLPSEQEQESIRQLWLLAASTGGPEAVVRFLQSVDRSIKGLGFLYAQHIEAQQLSILANTISRKTDWPTRIIEDGTRLLAGEVAIVSPAALTEIGRNGKAHNTDKPWPGRHKPAIDHLAADVARQYGAAAGMIVFTGMGDDGAAGSKFIARAGGQVWVQSPASCIAPSMPEAVLKNGRSHGMSEVADLAEKLNRSCNRSLPL